MRALIIACLVSTAPIVAADCAKDIDWRTSPLDLNLRGKNGERYCFRCPSGKPADGQVVGSGPYTDASSICGAAVHAGVIGPAGGQVTIEIRPARSRFRGSLRHYVQSVSYQADWDGTFVVAASVHGTAADAGHVRIE